MSTLTKNFNLIKPEKTDAADITNTNTNWDKVDERLSLSNIRSYTELSQFGLNDEEMSPTDFSSNIDKIVVALSNHPTTLMLTLHTDNNSNPNLHASVVEKLNADTAMTFKTDSHVGWMFIRFSGDAYRPVVIETNLETANFYDSVWSCVYNKGGGGNQVSAFVCNSSNTFTAEVGTNWKSDTTNGGYYQTISLSGILSTDNPIVDIVLGTSLSENWDKLIAWSNVTRVTTQNSSITLYANKSPSLAFTIQLKVVR